MFARRFVHNFELFVGIPRRVVATTVDAASVDSSRRLLAAVADWC
jgi:hypothetical protein